MATQYSNKPIVTNGLVYALDFGNQKSYVSGSTSARSLVYNPTPATFQTVPAGDYQGLAAAYSIRRVVSGYTGSVMVVQSASVSQSIGFDANGNLDTGSLLTFAGSGNAFVKIWYDQSGNGNNITQLTSSNQPQIVSSGSVILQNGKPCAKFDGVSSFLQSPSTVVVNGLSNLYFYTVVQTVDTSTSNEFRCIYHFGETGSWGQVFLAVATGSISARFGTSQVSNGLQASITTSTSLRLITTYKNSTTDFIDVNSTNVLTATGKLSTIANTENFFNLGKGTTLFANCHISEFIFYSTNQTSNNSSINTDINNYYNIYSPTTNPIPGFTSGLLSFESPDALLTNQTFTGFSYDRGNSTIMYVGETKGTSSLFTQDTNLSVVTTTSSVGFGSRLNNLGRTYPVTGLKHITLRFSSGSVDCFVNGIPVPANSVFPTGSSIAGGRFAIPAYTGSLGLIQIYNRPLTGDEIWNNYQLTTPRYGLGALQNKPYSLDDNAYLFLSQSGITDPIITSSINTFVLGLKSASLWDKMIAIYPFVGTGSVGVNLTGSHRWNLKEPSLVTYPLSFTGSWNGSVSGSTPSGSGTNITAGGITPSTYYPNYSSSNAHISILSYDTPTSSSMLAGTGMTREVAVSTLAGDYGTPAAAYSVRKVRTAYSGALMDVRRSIDNVTQSIGYVSNGDLDTGSLLNFVRTEGNSYLPGAYSGLAAAYSLRRVSGSYTGSAIQVNNGLVYRNIGFDASGNLDTGSLTPLVATGSNVSINSYSGLAAAYSVRKVVPVYAGPAIEVQSGSVSQSIGFDSIGNLDTVSLQSFAGSGNAFVKTWYDQSGNNKHAIQYSVPNQPQIVSSGILLTSSNYPAVNFNGTNMFLTSSDTNFPLAERSTFTVFQMNTQKLDGRIWAIWDGSGADFDETSGYIFQQGNITRNDEFGIFGSTGVSYFLSTGSRSTITPQSIVSEVLNGTTGSLYKNSTLAAQDTSFTAFNSVPANNFYIGVGIGNYGDIRIQEILIYTSSQATNRTYIENNVNAYFNAYTTASISTENAFVSTWYDQSGNNRHATQSVSTQQPLIVSSGSLVTLKGKPSIYFDSVDDAMLTPTLLDKPYAVILVAQQEVGSYIQRIINSPTRNSLIAITRVQETVAAAGDISSGSIGLVNTPYVVSLVNDTTSSQVYSNTVNKTTTFNNNDFGIMNFGASGVYNEPAQAFVSEVIAYTGSSQISSSRSLIENNINNYYSIYTSSNAGYVARWYDQSGNNRHATQVSESIQPQIVLSGSVVSSGTRPSLLWGSDGLTNLGFSRISNIQTVFHISQLVQTGSSQSFLLGDTTFFDYHAGTGDPQTWFSFNPPVEIRSSSNNYINGIQRDLDYSSTYYRNLDRNLITLIHTSAIGRANTISQDRAIPSRSWRGYIQEITLYTGSQVSNRQAVEYGINNYYNIYPQTSSFTTSSFAIYATSGSVSASLNNDLVSGISSTGPLGFITVSRTGSNSLTIARNGVTSSFAVPASGALSTGIYLGAINNNGLALANSPLGISFASVGTGLSNTEVNTYNGLVTGLQTNLKGYPNLVTNGLNLLLDANNLNSYPRTGTIWYDNSLFSNRVTVGSATFNPTSGSFTYSSGPSEIPYNVGLVTPSAFTISVWLKIITATAGYRGIAVTGRDTGGWYGLYVASGKFVMTPQNAFSPNSYALNTWYNVVYTAQGSTANLYENGVLVATSAYTTPTIAAGSKFFIGASGIGEDSNSDIAVIQTYNRALTQAEITQNFNATRGRFGV